MPKYIFAFDQSENSFPERCRLVSADEDAEFLRKSEDLTGTIVDTQAIEYLEALTERHASNASVIVELVDAPYWRFIEIRFNPAKAEESEQRPVTP